MFLPECCEISGLLRYLKLPSVGKMLFKVSNKYDVMNNTGATLSIHPLNFFKLDRQNYRFKTFKTNTYH